MKKLIMIIGSLGIGLFALAQPPQIDYTQNSEEDIFASIAAFESVDLEQTNICTPWTSTPRLKRIALNDQVVKNLMPYENLWVALNENCLKDLRTNNQLEVILNKRGRLISLKQNGKALDLNSKPALKTKKFTDLKGTAGKVIKVIIRIG